MTRLSLPVIDPARTEFGFHRTVCSCKECTLNCRHLPGYLIPADLDRIHQRLAPTEDMFEWARRHLLASPGALVKQHRETFRIHTLVPARAPSGACIFLDGEERCSIHAVAPFGCAFFDCRMPTRQADQRSLCGLEAIYLAWVNGDVYGQVWMALDRAELQAPPPESCRKQLKAALDQIQSTG